jgi:hypothetical protein
MNEETQEKANQVLAALIESVASVRDFAIEQAPDVIQQLLTWNFTTTLISFFGWLICIGLWLYVNWIQYKWIKNGGGRDGLGDLFPWIVINVFIQSIIILAFIKWINVSMDWLKIWLAPKLYLVEYAAELVK